MTVPYFPVCFLAFASAGPITMRVLQRSIGSGPKVAGCQADYPKLNIRSCVCEQLPPPHTGYSGRAAAGFQFQVGNTQLAPSMDLSRTHQAATDRNSNH